jgi:hypothetical protein
MTSHPQMNEEPDRRSELIPAGLLLGLALLLAIAAFILLAMGGDGEALKEVEPTLQAVQAQIEPTTPLPSSTHTLTPISTWTIMPSLTPTTTPTLTPTPTPTRLRVPTLTPARPYRFNERYFFYPVTAELIHQIARTVRDYPDARYNTPEKRLDPAYNASFIYPAIAFQEALLRFPDSEKTSDWIWGLAYTQARLGEAEAISQYQELLQQGLNEQRIPLDELPDWFHHNTLDLTLTIHTLDLPASQGELYLLEIPEGQVIYLLERVETGESSLYPLSAEFDFSSPQPAAYTTLDVDGDGVFELAVHQATSTLYTPLTEPRLFSLATLPPQELPVSLSLPKNYQMESSTVLTAAGAGLEVTTTFFPACPFTLTRLYTWDGAQLLAGGPSYSAQPQLDFLTYCEPLLTHALQHWEPAARNVLAQALLPNWPPESDPAGRPYPASAQDELRLKLAVNLALQGDLILSGASLSELLASPTDPDGEWVRAAQAFRQDLNSSGLYIACQNLTSCDLPAATQTILTLGDIRLLDQAVPAFQAAGVPIRSNGAFDFDQDDQDERWLLIQPRPLAALEFWIVAQTTGIVQAAFVDFVEGDMSAPYWSDPQVYPGIFQVTSRQGFRFTRLGSGLEGYIEPVTIEPILSTYTRDALFAAEHDLFSGIDPASVLSDLLVLKNSGRFNCTTHNICDRYRYVLGLAYELSGEGVLARDQYIELWWENSASPLAAMARLKLEFVPATARPTQTPRASATASPSLTQTLTPSPTPTVTP